MFLFNRRSLFAFVSCTVVCFFMSYQSAFLTDVLKKEKNIDPVWFGPILALPCIAYTISCILVNFIVGKFPRRLLVLVSFIMLAASMVLQGPSLMFGLPDSNIMVITGLALNGIA